MEIAKNLMSHMGGLLKRENKNGEGEEEEEEKKRGEKLKERK